MVLLMESVNDHNRPQKKLIVTSSWDDGSVSDVKLARLLDKYYMRSTFYVARCFEWNERALTEDEIIKLNNNHEIGAHTLTHPCLSRISLTIAKHEIIGSKKYLESLLGHKVNVFCYPGGIYNKYIMDMVKDAGFIGARTIKQGKFDMPDNPYEMPVTVFAGPSLFAGSDLINPIRVFNVWGVNKFSFKYFMDLEARAEELFDMALRSGGVYHIWGHASEIEKYNGWEKIERIFKYIANRTGVEYLTNGEVLERLFHPC